jgi:vacuolar-type H+-ATPase catalytic subunit A/Vma1
MANTFMDSTTVEEIGQVVSVSDGVAMVKGIDHCLSNELIMFTSNTFGIAMNLEPERVGVVLLGESGEVVEGIMCKRTGKTVSIPVGTGLLGRVVDPLGNPIDGKGQIRSIRTRPIESPAPSIVDRSQVNRPLETGITAIDSMTPIGRGQRELIIGDRQTGKNGGSHRYHHQPEEQECSLCITWRSERRCRPSYRLLILSRSTTRYPIPASSRPAPASGIAAVYRTVFRMRHCRRIHVFGPFGRSRCLRRPDPALPRHYRAYRCCFAVRRDVKRIPETSSILIRDSLSVPPN